MFKFRYLVALILLVVLVAAVGNAADLSVDSATQTVVAGSSLDYSDEDVEVAYTINNAGTVTATVSVLGGKSFDAMSVNFADDSVADYVPCTDSSAGAGTLWSCGTIINTDLVAVSSISLIATRN